MALVDVSNGKNRHICYRDSKLTFLLRVDTKPVFERLCNNLCLTILLESNTVVVHLLKNIVYCDSKSII